MRSILSNEQTKHATKESEQSDFSAERSLKLLFIFFANHLCFFSSHDCLFALFPSILFAFLLVCLLSLYRSCICPVNYSCEELELGLVRLEGIVDGDELEESGKVGWRWSFQMEKGGGNAFGSFFFVFTASLAIVRKSQSTWRFDSGVSRERRDTVGRNMVEQRATLSNRGRFQSASVLQNSGLCVYRN